MSPVIVVVIGLLFDGIIVELHASQSGTWQGPAGVRVYASEPGCVTIIAMHVDRQQPTVCS